MDSVEMSSYRPPPDFEEDSSEQLVNLDLSDCTELFLIQWPLHQHPEINGKEFTLQLGPDGKLGSFVDSAGKAYDLVSSASKEPDATVILSSASEPRIVGKISRRVSLVQYMEPEEYLKLTADKRLKSSGTLMTNSSNLFATPTQSKVRRSSQSYGRTVSTHGSRQKSAFSGMNEQSKSSKRKQDDESARSMNHRAESHGTTPSLGLSEHHERSTTVSGKGENASTLSGSLQHSHKSKSKKKKVKSEE